MKGLHKIIFPFAPDQSGAVSVLAGLSGIIVIVDAGGCTGNICGFDLPGWVQSDASGKEPWIFSAGLRDMDAIFGRDRALIDKLAKVAEHADAPFAALVGTPVPATIGTDFGALKKMAEKPLGIPVLAIDTNGAAWYDKGVEKAYLALLDAFAESDDRTVIDNSVGIFGLTSLDFGNRHAKERLESALKGTGADTVRVYGTPGSLSFFREAGRMEKNLVVSPAGLAPAEYLQKKYGTPYSILPEPFDTTGMGEDAALSGKRILIVHQQVMADARRNRIRRLTDAKADITCATFFSFEKELAEPSDMHLADEDAYLSLVRNGHFDAVLADESLLAAIPFFTGSRIAFPHYAVSGKEETA